MYFQYTVGYDDDDNDDDDDEVIISIGLHKEELHNLQFIYYCHNSDLQEAKEVETRNPYIILLSEQALTRKGNERIILRRISGRLIVRMGVQ